MTGPFLCSGKRSVFAAEGTYAFIGDAGKRPLIRGVVGVTDAPV